jgi:divalent metal cation (Fe/Co/Zn/Cd) transporter
VPGEESSGETQFEKLIRRIAHVADRVTGAGTSHNVQIHEIDGHLIATVHVTLPAAQPLTEAHALAEEVDRRILREIPLVKRVVVHVEPPEENAE